MQPARLATRKKPQQQQQQQQLGLLVGILVVGVLYLSYLWTVRSHALSELQQQQQLHQHTEQHTEQPIAVMLKVTTLAPSSAVVESVHVEQEEEEEEEEMQGEEEEGIAVSTPTDLEEDEEDRVTVSTPPVKAEVSPLPPSSSSSSYLSQFTPHGRYFFYQPSGGWGNQRFILRWAILAANAMNRTLAVCAMAPHSDIWHGYNAWNKTDLVPADRLLDVQALNQAVIRGVVFLDDVPARFIKSLTNYTVRVFVKGHYVNRFAAEKKLLVYRESDIARDWLLDASSIVFWDKMSMWQCCVPDHAVDQIWLGKHIMFNSRLKLLAREIAQSTFGGVTGYNAVHIRRGDMTIASDRRTAEVYYKKHRLHLFNSDLPLYIATNERNHTWFDYLVTKFPRGVVFWHQLKYDTDGKLLAEFPEKMRGDVSGFLDMLLCGNAVKWQGSLKSTFSAAIGAIRISSQLRDVEWEFPEKPSVRMGLKPLLPWPTLPPPPPQ